MSETTETGGSEAAPEDIVHPTGEGQSPAPAETTADEATADPEPADETPEWAKRRFGEMTAKLRSAERRAEVAEALAMRPQQPAAPPADTGPQPLPADIARALGPEPKPSDFTAGEFDPAYARAMAQYDRNHDQAKHAAAQRQAAQQQHQTQFSQKVDGIIADGKTRFADFNDVVNSIEALRVPGLGQAIAAEIAECEKPADVAYFLGRNPEVAAQLKQARNPQAIARILTRVEARLSAAPPPPKLTSAPAPPPVVSGRSSPARTVYEAKDYADYKRQRMGS